MAAILEREIKLGFRDADEARQAILATGATPLRGRRLQEDYLLDTPDDTLRRRRCVLRVRLECGKTLLTFKGPVQNSPMKLREEMETVVGDGLLLLHVLEELGFRVWFRYEKYREEFAHEDVTIAIDETPVGTFVEIEGSEQGIHDMAAALARQAGRLRHRFVPRPLREALRAARPAADRHAVRGILTASRRSHSDRRPRHAPPAALLRSRETRRARRRRAARAPPSSVRRAARASATSC